MMAPPTQLDRRRDRVGSPGLAMKPSDLVGWLGGLTLLGGDLDGQRLTVWPWEARFIRGVWSGPGDGALSVARGNGKSGLVAGIGSAVVDPSGPLHSRRAEVVVVASSFQQGRVIFEDVVGFLRPRHDLTKRNTWRMQDSAQLASLEHRPSGARIRCIGSDPRRAHGLRPRLVLADEPAQWEPGKADRMLAALRTGLGKVPGSKLIALGTRSDDPGHWFSKMLTTAAYAQVHAARPDVPPFLLSTIRRANPSLEYLPSLKARILAEREDARRDPDQLAEWKALRLNMGVSDTAVAVLLDADTWRRAEGEEAERRGGAVWGIDLGSGQAMSAVAAYFPSGRLDALAAFPELPSLAQRGISDGVGRLYQKMAERGELIRAGRRVADVKALLSEALARYGRPVAIVADRWREAELRDALEALSFPQAALITRGQGYRDGGEDVRAFRRAFLEGRVTPVPSLLLTAAMGEARTVSDPAGNEKLSKKSEGGRRSRAKDDAAAAAILAVAVGDRKWSKAPDPRRRRSAVVG